MKKTITGILLAVFMGISSTAFAAHSDSGMPNFKGDWHPVTGAGAIYQVQEKGQRATDWEVAVVGKEGSAYWLEMRVTSPEPAIMKMLVDSANAPKRMIVKAAGQPAMELPSMGNDTGAPATNLKQTAKLVGTETITTPAGKFSCEHYQDRDHGVTVDIWLSSQVSPYGLVKMTSAKTAMTLTKVITGAKTRITETPQKFSMPGLGNLSEMMNQ